MITVKALIRILKSYPEDAVISVDADKNLISDNITMRLVEAVLDVDKDAGYYGEHKIITDDFHSKEDCLHGERFCISHIERPYCILSISKVEFPKDLDLRFSDSSVIPYS